MRAFLWLVTAWFYIGAANAQSLDRNALTLDLLDAGLTRGDSLAIVGVQANDSLTTNTQREAINSTLAAELPRRFTYLDRTQLLKIVGQVGSGDGVIDSIWDQLQGDCSSLAGLVFYDVTKVKDGNATLSISVHLCNGQVVRSNDVRIGVPPTDAARRYESVIDGFAARISGKSPKSTSVAINGTRDVRDPFDCVTVFQKALGAAIQSNDARRITGDAPRFISLDGGADVTATVEVIERDERHYLSLSAPALGLYDPNVAIQQPSNCSVSPTHRSLFERAMAASSNAVIIEPMNPPLRDQQKADFLVTSRSGETWMHCAFIDNSSEGFTLKNSIAVDASPTRLLKTALGGPLRFHYDETGRAALVCYSGGKAQIMRLVDVVPTFTKLNEDELSKWLQVGDEATLRLTAYEYIVTK